MALSHRAVRTLHSTGEAPFRSYATNLQVSCERGKMHAAMLRERRAFVATFVSITLVAELPLKRQTTPDPCACLLTACLRARAYVG